MSVFGTSFLLLKAFEMADGLCTILLSKCLLISRLHLAVGFISTVQAVSVQGALLGFSL